MLISLSDGRCRECGGQLEITDADDVSLTTTCTECGDESRVETDAFNDGAVHYWPHFMAERLQGGNREND